MYVRLLTEGEPLTEEPTLDCSLNYLTYIECARCDGACGNREVQLEGKSQWRQKMRIEFINEGVGVGVVAAKKLLCNEYLGFTTGEALDTKEFERRRKDPLLNDYIFGVSTEVRHPVIRAIDPKVVGNHARFFNNSCSPNCCFEIWSVARSTYLQV